MKRKNIEETNSISSKEDEAIKRALLCKNNEEEDLYEDDQMVSDYIEEDDDEEDNMSDMEDDEMISNVLTKKKSNNGGDNLYKVPTREEVRQLTETQELFKSNLFKLQMEELFKEITLNEKSKKKLETSLHQIKGILDGLAPQPSVDITQFIKYMSEKEDIKVPIANVLPSLETNMRDESNSNSLTSFKFAPPSAVYVVGSFLLQSFIKSKDSLMVDMAIEMPKDIFDEKDYLNYNYFYKRACYLAFIAKSLKKHTKSNKNDKFNIISESMSFQYIQQDPRRPALILQISKSLSIRISPMLQQQTFSVYQFGPRKCNIRPLLFQVDGEVPESQSMELKPTPKYNSSLLMDTTYLLHMNYLFKVSQSCPAFREAILLGKVWLSQRGFNQQQIGFNGFLWSMLLAHLLTNHDQIEESKHRLSPTYSSYQLFKLTLDFIASHNFCSNPILMASVQPKNLEAFKKSFDCIFIDPSGHINLTAFFTKGHMDLIQREAIMSTKLLNDGDNDHFKTIFLSKFTLEATRFDFTFRLSTGDAEVIHPSNYASEKDILTKAELINNQSLRFVREALKDRILHIHGQVSVPFASWSINEATSIPDELELFVVAHASNMLKIVEHGPSPTDKEASENFKLLWGRKVQMRRFKDGSILNSVVWENGVTFEEKISILPQMIRFLMTIHGGVKSTEIKGTDKIYDIIKHLLIHPETGKLETFKASADAFHLLKRLVRDLELPLAVENIHSCSSSLRYTSVYPEISSTEPMQVLIEFEKSSRWPDNLKAIQEMKMAFYIKMYQLIMDQYPDQIEASVYDNSINGSENILEDRYLRLELNGFIFHCRIHHDREGYLIDQLEESYQQTSLKQQYLLQTQVIPALSNRIYNVSVEHPFIATTIRLVKRWAAAHMLSGVIPPLAVEMLVLYALWSNQNEESLGNVWTGFCRVMKCLANMDILNDLLQVSFDARHAQSRKLKVQNQEKVQKLQKQIEDQFMISRKTEIPKKALFLASEVDPECLIWAEDSNCMLIANRLQQLARLTLSVVEKSKGYLNAFDIWSFFKPSFKGYDAVLQMSKEIVPTDTQHLIMMYKKQLPMELSIGQPLLIKQMIHELEAAFKETCMFFYDEYSGNKVAVLFKPHLKSQKLPFKPMNAFSSVPLTLSEKTVKANIEGMIHEMQILTQGLVDVCLLSNEN